MALGECGRFPIFIDCYTRVVKYWCRLLSLPDSRYPRQCYLMLHSHDKSGRKNWASKVRFLLCSHGFGYAWEAQSVGNVSSFIAAFRQRLKDTFRQEWCSSLSSYSDYLSYHPEILRASYISTILTTEHRRALCLLRCGRLPLNGISRFGAPLTDPFCKQCNSNCVEDLCHFLLVCPRYTALRTRLIPRYYYRFPSSFKVQMLCTHMSEKLAFKTALYVSECLAIRK